PGEPDHVRQRPMTVAPVKCLYLSVSPSAIGLAFAFVGWYVIERQRAKAFAFHNELTGFFELGIGSFRSRLNLAYAEFLCSALDGTLQLLRLHTSRLRQCVLEAVRPAGLLNRHKTRDGSNRLPSSVPRVFDASLAIRHYLR